MVWGDGAAEADGNEEAAEGEGAEKQGQEMEETAAENTTNDDK